MGSREWITYFRFCLQNIRAYFCKILPMRKWKGYSLEESAGRNVVITERPCKNQEDQLDILRKAIKNRQQCLVVLKIIVKACSSVLDMISFLDFLMIPVNRFIF